MTEWGMSGMTGRGWRDDGVRVAWMIGRGMPGKAGWGGGMMAERNFIKGLLRMDSR